MTKKSIQHTQNGSIRNEVKVFSLSLKVCQYHLIRNFFRKYSPAPSLPLLAKFGHKFFRATLFFPIPFDLFGRNFEHLATLSLGLGVAVALKVMTIRLLSSFPLPFLGGGGGFSVYYEDFPLVNVANARDVEKTLQN